MQAVQGAMPNYMLPAMPGAPMGFGGPMASGGSEIDQLLGESHLLSQSMLAHGNQLEAQQQEREAIAAVQAQQAYQIALQRQTLARYQAELLSLQQATIPTMANNSLIERGYQAGFGNFANGLRGIPPQTLLPNWMNGIPASPPVPPSSPPKKAPVKKNKNGDAPVIHGPLDGNGTPTNLTSIGGKHKLHAQAAEMYKKADAAYKAQTGKALPVISSYRSPEHNARIGGAKGSNHTKGSAIDLNQAGMSESEFKLATKILRQHGFEPLEGVTYVKHGKPQDEANHFNFVGPGNANVHLS